MKVVYAFCIFVAFVSAGCSGNKGIKPSEDSLRTKEAMELINIIQTAYQERNSEVLARNMDPVVAKNILSELSFEKVELYFTPWIVRIKESSTIINAGWKGKWFYGDREIERRGIADFVFTDSPMKLAHIEGDNPFSTRPVEQKLEMRDIQEDPLESEKAPLAGNDEMKLESAAQPAEEKDGKGESALVLEPTVNGAETPDLQPLKRTKLLYREQDLVSTEQPKAVQGDEEQKYIVQVGAWKNTQYARTALELVKGYYPEAVIIEEGGFHKIRINKMMTRHEGTLTIEDLDEKFNLRSILIGLDVPSIENRTAVPVAADPHTYFIRIGVWRNPEFAESAFDQLKRSYPEAVIVRENNFHKVGIPVTMSREQAFALVHEIKEKLNLNPILVEK